MDQANSRDREFLEFVIKHSSNRLDKSERIARAKADGGYGLLWSDPHPMVRLEVARRGESLPYLFDDKSPKVRAAVASNGFALDVLIHDPAARDAAIGYLKSVGMTLDEWKRANPAKCRDPESLREMMQQRKAGISDISNKSNKSNNDDRSGKSGKIGYKPYSSLTEKERRRVDSPDAGVRARAAMGKLGLDLLFRDEDEYVRSCVARTGKFTEELSEDPSSLVRSTVARKGRWLSKLYKDENALVRAQVAAKDYKPDILCRDESWNVRRVVAMRGFALNLLAGDDEAAVRDAVSRYLDREGMTLDEWKRVHPDRCVNADSASKPRNPAHSAHIQAPISDMSIAPRNQGMPSHR